MATNPFQVTNTTDASLAESAKDNPVPENVFRDAIRDSYDAVLKGDDKRKVKHVPLAGYQAADVEKRLRSDASKEGLTAVVRKVNKDGERERELANVTALRFIVREPKTRNKGSGKSDKPEGKS